jgi:hypothetical protein
MIVGETLRSPPVAVPELEGVAAVVAVGVAVGVSVEVGVGDSVGEGVGVAGSNVGAGVWHRGRVSPVTHGRRVGCGVGAGSREGSAVTELSALGDEVKRAVDPGATLTHPASKMATQPSPTRRRLGE